MKSKTSLLFSIAKANAVISRQLSVLLPDFRDYMILHYLLEAPGQKLRRIDLAEKMGVTASGVTRMLITLEKLGIVSRDMGSEDARTRYASITKAGKKLFEDATITLEMKVDSVIPNGQADLIREFNLLVETMISNLTQAKPRTEEDRLRTEKFFNPNK